MSELIPEVTEEDISWVCSLMGIHSLDEQRRNFLKRRTTVDVSACPGSGKTTLIVAKLAMLARKWPHRYRGICVLSHTNVAREQIEQRLGKSGVGQLLLGYPHFTETIHGFVNRFLTLPYLYSKGFPVEIIDDDIAQRWRWGRLPHNIRSGLENNNHQANLLKITDKNFNLGSVRWGRGTLGENTPTYQGLVNACQQSADRGYFCHDEMFVWAQAHLEEVPSLADWLQIRFPLIILDEMQDTDNQQSDFLNRIFPRNASQIVIQRVGDPNQKIFKDESSFGDGACFPDSDSNRCLEITSSYRFGNKIAALASPFAVQPVGSNGLQGLAAEVITGAEQTELKHTIFIFPNDNTAGVLDAYGKHVLTTLGSENITQGLITAVGHIHKEDDEVRPGHGHFPKTVSHYWNGYSSILAKKDAYPSNFVIYIQAAISLIQEGHSLAPAVGKFAQGILQVARCIGDTNHLKGKPQPHRAIVDALKDKDHELKIYQELLRYLFTERQPISQANWQAFKDKVLAVACALCNGPTDPRRAENFLSWVDNDSLTTVAESSNEGALPNVYRVTEGNQYVDIKLGSIHSVKGQTHIATLVLHTYWQRDGHSTKRMMPWLLGDKINHSNARVQDTERLRHMYVAMTRPSHLLCLAIPKLAFSNQDQQMSTLRSRGWFVQELS